MGESKAALYLQIIGHKDHIKRLEEDLKLAKDFIQATRKELISKPPTERECCIGCSLPLDVKNVNKRLSEVWEQLNYNTSIFRVIIGYISGKRVNMVKKLIAQNKKVLENK